MSLLDDSRLRRLRFEYELALAVGDVDGAECWLEHLVALKRDKRRIAIDELVSALRVPDDLSEL